MDAAEDLSYPDPLLLMFCIASVVFLLSTRDQPSDHCNLVWKKVQAAKQRCAKMKGTQAGPLTVCV